MSAQTHEADGGSINAWGYCSKCHKQIEQLIKEMTMAKPEVEKGMNQRIEMEANNTKELGLLVSAYWAEGIRLVSLDYLLHGRFNCVFEGPIRGETK
jgi:hypothetical protein